MTHPAPPTIQLPTAGWLDPYHKGWRQIRRRLRRAPSVDLLQAIYAARTDWRHHSLEDRLDQCVQQLGLQAEEGSRLQALWIWVEWSLYQLSGNRRRLDWLVQNSQALQQKLSKAGDGAGLDHMLALHALGQMHSEIGRDNHALDHATAEMGHRLEADAGRSNLERLLAGCLGSLMAEESGLGLEDEIRRLSQIGPEVDLRPDQLSDQMVMGAHLIKQLRLRDHPLLARQFSHNLAASCKKQRDLHWLLPGLLLEGVIGCEPHAAGGHLTWWLAEAPPVGIQDLPFGPGTLSLMAVASAGSGIQVELQHDVPLSLEIITLETLYLEHLRPGTHLLRLTVLDRTDVIGA